MFLQEGHASRRPFPEDEKAGGDLLAHLLYEGDPENSQGNLDYVPQLEGYGGSNADYFTSSINHHKLMI